LADNIAQVGLINPPTVREVPAGYELVAGHRRLRAFKLLGRPLIPVHVVEADDSETAAITASENLQRSNLSAMEEAEQLDVLVNAHPNAVEGVASQLGRSVSWILDRLDLLTWPTNLQAALHAKRISIGAGKHLARIPDPDLRELRIQQAVAHGCNAATAALWLQDAIASNSQPENVSHPEVEIGPDRILTETTAICFLCSNRVELQQTASRRLCLDCLAHIEQSKKGQAQPQQQLTPGLEVTNPLPPPNPRVP
jgi:ParB/RepB/Spo0J family partition protein